MTKKTIKWVAIVFDSLLIPPLLFYAFTYLREQARINKVYGLSLPTVAIPGDPAQPKSIYLYLQTIRK
jgi:hypothetical protein